MNPYYQWQIVLFTLLTSWFTACDAPNLSLEKTTPDLNKSQKEVSWEDDIDACDEQGRSHLYNAAIASDFQLMKKLLSDGLDVNLPDDTGKTVLHYACQTNKSSFVALLVNQVDINLDAQDLAGRTPLHLAVINSNLRGAQLLLSKKININLQDNQEKTALHYFCETLHLQEQLFFDSLIAYPDINLNIADCHGRTPLHIMCQYNFPSLVIKLIQQGANDQLLDHDNQSPLSIAQSFNSRKTSKILASKARIRNISDFPQQINIPPILIKDAQDFVSIGRDPKFPLDGTYQIVKDIDLNGRYIKPIGNTEQPFRGKIYGGNYNISNFIINQQGKNKNYVGLFSCLGDQALINGMIIKRAYIRGKNYVGAFAGINYGRIEGCKLHSKNTIQGRNVVGGFVGALQDGGVLIQCTSGGMVAVKGCQKIGGLVGVQCKNALIQDCYFLGEIIEKDNGSKSQKE